VIKYSKRPYANVEEMDEALVANWNERVQPGDRVYHLGDFSFHKPARTATILSRLKGEIHFIKGNHDSNLKGDLLNRFASFGDYKDIKVGGQHIVLFHYSLRVWNRSHAGAWQLYGHSHGSLDNPDSLLSFDVGVDPQNYRPINFEEVREQMEGKTWKSVDHHGRERVE